MAARCAASMEQRIRETLLPPGIMMGSRKLPSSRWNVSPDAVAHPLGEVVELSGGEVPQQDAQAEAAPAGGGP